eukprot:TRINITY_DN3433_c0_g2_i1.p1 TRINITY_DN3433_c0_g2~~TRINITY_DN3433_c0_g2_i1.p1  ORF type:complete len:146 (-),score=24.66 TRINITY_DN3433_c0_g2_i1:64-501(-)
MSRTRKVHFDRRFQSNIDIDERLTQERKFIRKSLLPIFKLSGTESVNEIVRDAVRNHIGTSYLPSNFTKRYTQRTNEYHDHLIQDRGISKRSTTSTVNDTWLEDELPSSSPIKAKVSPLGTSRACVDEIMTEMGEEEEEGLVVVD